MRNRNQSTARITLVLSFLLLAAAAPPASAQVHFEIIGEFYLSELSADGTAGAGSMADGTWENCRWTVADGVVPLGMPTTIIDGKIGATSPGISADGLRIGGSIASLDSTVLTQGRWTKGSGWQQSMPPLPPGGAVIDDAVGSCNSISGDGETIGGHMWVVGSRTHACTWTQSGGVVDLGVRFPDTSSRADAIDYDGNVVVGWSSDATNTWQPTVWEDGVLTVLYEDLVGNWASAVNADGTIIGGCAYNPTTLKSPATLWIKSGDTWQQNELGVLPGTPAYQRAIVYGIANDGSVAVGRNHFASNNYTGFVWTLEQGMVKAKDYILSLGAVLPEVFTVLSMTSVTHDGRVIGGYGIDGDPYNGGTLVSFLVERWTTTAAPPVGTPPVVRLEMAYPNPFNPSTSLPIVVERDGRVRLSIFDVAGRRVRALHDGPLSVGRHVLTWDGRDDSGASVPSGIYLARAQGEWGSSEVRRLTLVK